jgi:glycosyltransferase involved in cell wall biosynthesis
MLKFLYVYKWATFGGVERVMLSRAEAFKKYGIKCRILMHYLEDSGALEKFKSYVATRGLEDYLQIVPSIQGITYDYLVSIDTPEVFDFGIPIDKILLECHTAYAANRVYLDSVPDDLKFVIVPSEVLKNEIYCERKHLRHKLKVVRNFVPNISEETVNFPTLWNKRPLLYVGRMDEHKNILEVLDIFEKYRVVYDDDLMLVLVGPYPHDSDLNAEIERRRIAARVLYFPPVGFDKAHLIYRIVEQHNGIFISASKGESFGLSVAEAICAGLPVLLSGIQAHREMVHHDSRCLYTINDCNEAIKKLRFIVENYERMKKNTSLYQKQLSADAFIEDWELFLSVLVQ